jgi:hypothetical protein
MRILPKNHIITGNEYFRQKEFCPYDSDNYAVSKFISKWTSIRYLVAPIWKNKQLGALDKQDEQYPYDPSFFNKYEFIVFEDEVEHDLTDTFKDKQIKEIDGRMHSCFQLWVDWGIFLVNSMTKQEINYIINTPSNQCPYCKEGIILSKNGRYGKFNGCSNFPKCRYSENKLSDTYTEYIKQKEYLEHLKECINTVGLKNINMRLLKTEMRDNQ